MQRVKTADFQTATHSSLKNATGGFSDKILSQNLNLYAST